MHAFVGYGMVSGVKLENNAQQNTFEREKKRKNHTRHYSDFSFSIWQRNDLVCAHESVRPQRRIVLLLLYTTASVMHSFDIWHSGRKTLRTYAGTCSEHVNLKRLSDFWRAFGYNPVGPTFYCILFSHGFLADKSASRRRFSRASSLPRSGAQVNVCLGGGGVGGSAGQTERSFIFVFSASDECWSVARDELLLPPRVRVPFIIVITYYYYYYYYCYCYCYYYRRLYLTCRVTVTDWGV